ncbi:MAG: type II toxin-antitoxin system PemK/MazF family toxin [Beijerinckiaceae bacterium]
MKRGEVWSIAGAGYAGKPRPGIVIQSDLFAGTASVTVCLFTTTAVDGSLVRIAVEATEANGLFAQSFAMTDKVLTIPKTGLGRRLGTLGADDMTRIDIAILEFLGLVDQE